jgi:ubiquitin-activating enzyme E1
MEFIFAIASLRATVYSIDCSVEQTQPTYIATVCSRTPLPRFEPSSGTIATTEEEAKQQQQQAASGANLLDIDKAFDQMPPPMNFGFGSVTAIDFDKDIDAHMRVVASTGNLRARNYRIPEADMHRARGIAGKIIPAIATTTAFVSGMSTLEMMKLIQNAPLDKYINSFTNLAVPLFTRLV